MNIEWYFKLTMSRPSSILINLWALLYLIDTCNQTRISTQIRTSRESEQPGKLIQLFSNLVSKSAPRCRCLVANCQRSAMDARVLRGPATARISPQPSPTVLCVQCAVALDTGRNLPYLAVNSKVAKVAHNNWLIRTLMLFVVDMQIRTA